jgi:hypothetical protein
MSAKNRRVRFPGGFFPRKVEMDPDRDVRFVLCKPSGGKTPARRIPFTNPQGENRRTAGGGFLSHGCMM